MIKRRKAFPIARGGPYTTAEMRINGEQELGVQAGALLSHRHQRG